VLLVNLARDGLNAVASRGFFQDFEMTQLPKGKGLSWASLESRQIIYTENALEDPRTHNPRPDIHAPHAQLTAPLLDSAQQPLGVLQVARNWPRQFSTQEVRTMEVVARVASTALERSRMIAHLLQQKTQREQAFEGALRTIGMALEARDLETAGHTDRVSSLAQEVGQELGLPTTALQELRWGSFLHDIGKLAIPDHILLKPGLLDEQERSVMQTHCELGYHFTQGLPFLPEASRQVIRYHQERWNGQGYPEGLRQNTIPLLARIFSVCDVFDALISPRPYKLTWRVKDALLEIANQAGLQFDPQVVSAFLRVIRRNPKVIE
jgi:HD-GYP domain-containing protein (c-di-GMP phosphodiesterase class II)